MYGNCVNNIFNCIRGGVSLRLGESVGKCVNRVDYFGVDISDGFTFGIDDEFEMVYSGGFFDCLNDRKPWVKLQNEPLE